MKEPLFLKKLTYFLYFFLLIACHKPEEPTPKQLPTITTTGANTFGCMVNGELWVPYGERKASQTQTTLKALEASYYKGYFRIDANLFAKNENIHLQSDSITRVGTYFIKKDQGKVEANYLIDKDTCGTSTVEGVLHITRLDPEFKIISGQFEFTIAKPGCSPIYVTEGTFDVVYQ